MGLMKDLCMVLGILSIGFGGILLFGSYEIWRLYFNGPDYCRLPYSYPSPDPTCSSIVITIAQFAAAGGFFVGIGPVLLFMSRDGAKPPTLPNTKTTS